MKKIKLFLVDDHKMIRDAIATYLSDDERFEVVNQADHGEEALPLIDENPNFDVLLTDIVMPKMDGIELVRQMKLKSYDFKIIALTMLSEAQHVKRMLNNGVDGYLLKTSSQAEIIEAILEVMEGKKYYSEQVKDLINDYLSGKKAKVETPMSMPLTRREKDVLHLIIKEYSDQEIADELFISIRSVEAHKMNLLEKTGHKNRAGLAIWAVEKRLFEDF